ncbi:MAG TPA: OmpA family protein [Aliidongia sp.]|nr:OmpA family protein [Aliidongia sp.]
MKNQLGVCAAVLLGSMSTAALADDPTYGPYISVGGGPAWENSITAKGVATDTHVDFDTGFLGVGAVGWGFGNGLRGELEFGWHQNDASGNFTQSSGGAFVNSNSGRATQQTVFGNLLYDFDTGTPWSPHVGFGLGFDSARVDGIATGVGFNPVNTHDTVFGYQAIAGVEYALAPGFHVGLEYRYIGTSDLVITVPGNAANNGSIRSSYNLGTHNILATMRFNFGEPPAAAPPVVAPPPVSPPPAPPAPPVEPAREFQVFFDFNKSDITAAAAKTIQAAADTVKAGHVAHLTVTGHTDTVGSDKYNQGLSERRAASVKKQLVTDGVSGDEISTIGVGKSGLLVPTKDGVREPQNRRATIDLQ